MGTIFACEHGNYGNCGACNTKQLLAEQRRDNEIAEQAQREARQAEQARARDAEAARQQAEQAHQEARQARRDQEAATKQAEYDRRQDEARREKARQREHRENLEEAERLRQSVEQARQDAERVADQSRREAEDRRFEQERSAHIRSTAEERAWAAAKDWIVTLAESEGRQPYPGEIEAEMRSRLSTYETLVEIELDEIAKRLQREREEVWRRQAEQEAQRQAAVDAAERPYRRSRSARTQSEWDRVRFLATIVGVERGSRGYPIRATDYSGKLLQVKATPTEQLQAEWDQLMQAFYRVQSAALGQLQAELEPLISREKGDRTYRLVYHTSPYIGLFWLFHIRPWMLDAECQDLDALVRSVLQISVAAEFTGGWLKGPRTIVLAYGRAMTTCPHAWVPIEGIRDSHCTYCSFEDIYRRVRQSYSAQSVTDGWNTDELAILGYRWHERVWTPRVTYFSDPGTGEPIVSLFPCNQPMAGSNARSERTELMGTLRSYSGPHFNSSHIAKWSGGSEVLARAFQRYLDDFEYPYHPELTQVSA